MGSQRVGHDWTTELNWSMALGQDPVFPKSAPPIRKLAQSSYPPPPEGRQNETHNHRKLTKMITWSTALCNWMKLWAMPSRAMQGGQMMMKSSDKTWSNGQGNGKPLQHSCLENLTDSMKMEKDMTLTDETPSLIGVQYTTGEEWRNSSRRNEEIELKQKW